MSIDFNIPAFLTLTKKDENGVTKRYFRTTASSSVVDAHDDEFTPRCVEKMASQANGSGMSIFLNHEYRIPEDLFGTTTEAVAIKRASADGASMVTDMDLIGFINEANPRARETADALEGGARLGVSIGARIKDYRPRDEKDPMGGWIIDDVELKETSIVGMPANPRSWVHYATKAINGFERERVKEATDMTKKATDIAQAPVDVSITDAEDEETMKLMESAVTDPDTVKVLSTETMPGGPATMVDGEDEGQPTFDGAPESDEDVPDAADDAAPEETTEKADGLDGSPEDEAESETPVEDALSKELSSSAEDLSIAAVRAAKEEILKRDEEITQLKEELETALATLATATAIVEKIATTPVGRKAVVRKQVDDYRTRITGTYDPEFMKFLKGSNPQ
jgi:phage head maturation protease